MPTKKVVAKKNAPATNEIPHGTTVTAVLALKSIGTKLNYLKKLTIVTAGCAQHPAGTYLYSVDHLNNFAEETGSANGRMLRNAIASGISANYFSVEFVRCVKGQLVLNDDGSEILDLDTGEPKEYQKTFWKSTNEKFILGADAKRYISELNMKADLMAIQNQTEANQAEADAIKAEKALGNTSSDVTDESIDDDMEF